MKITEEEVVQDVQRMFDTGNYEIPVTDIHATYFHGTNKPEYRISLVQDPVELGVLVRFVNYYLEKKTKHLEGEVTVTTDEDGEVVVVSRQDEDHKILKVIWEKK